MFPTNPPWQGSKCCLNLLGFILSWKTSNKLTLHISKTSFILFSPKKMSADKFSLTIRGERINRTLVAKYLELLIDEKLKFDVHVKRVCKKLSQLCGIFCYLRHYICQKTLLMLYYSLVNSHNYTLWDLIMGFNQPSNLAAIASPSNLTYKNCLQNVSKNKHVKNNTFIF